ncbi:MAG TPA: tetratricopeptide repeat protein [Spirochaetia bacterium]|nr:tetratricopeptide repeat protein [Spirochaetia bacterium]
MRLRRATVVVSAAVFLLSAALLSAQATRDETLNEMYGRARQAISQEAYESAVKILTSAKERFPDAPKVNLALADLYYDKELYNLALEEYQAAEKKGATDITTLTQISRCFGKLNQEKQSINYLTRILSLWPDSADTVDDLGWMYFKTHQLDKGETVVRKGITRLGLQRSLAMTLGTIYSGMNRYDSSRDYYEKAIDEALKVGDRSFAAIAYYNLSLLEHNFFHYNSALRATDQSIAMDDRPSGHLARGELFESRLDFSSAQAEYQSAYAQDTTPLSKVNIAILLQKMGQLELARRYGEEVLSSKDLAWMVYYGTDVIRHFKDVHELLRDVYAGLARQEVEKPTAGIFARLSSLFAAARDLVLSWYHREMFRMYSIVVGKQYLAEGSYEDAWWEFYRGNRGYREVALKYLLMAKRLETARTPHAEFFYEQEEGKLLASPELLRSSIDGFDPFWEKEATAESLVALAPLLHGADRQQVISRLFGLNPGALQQAGLGLPLNVAFQGTDFSAREKRLILRYLRRAGSECETGAGASLRYTLTLTRLAGGSVRWSVVDSDSGTTIAGGNPLFAGRPALRCANFVKSILDDLYSVH